MLSVFYFVEQFQKNDDNRKSYKNTIQEYQIEFDSVILNFLLGVKDKIEKTSGILEASPLISIPELAE